MLYSLPILTLLAVMACFFLLARGHDSQSRALPTLRIIAALPLLLSAVSMHFLHPSIAASIIPPGFPHPFLLVVLSGVFEICGAIGLFLPKIRRLTALLIAFMMIAIFPANIYAAGKTISGLHMPSVPVRTTMQAVYILLVLVAGYGWPRRSAV